MIGSLAPLAILLAAAAGPAGTAPAAEIAAAASPLIAGLCVAVPERDGVLRCAGLVGTDIFLLGGEEGRLVSLGSDRAFPPPLPPGATLSRTLEWRVDGVRPLAGIVRYRVAAEGGAMRWIVVLKAGSAERPGCVVALVDEEAEPTAIDTARRVADERAVGFRCGVDRPEVAGRAGDPTRRIGSAWVTSPR